MNNKNQEKKTIASADINRIVWSACDTFRGPMDPTQYKDYILVTLFWKYISDVFAKHKKTIQSEHGDKPGVVARMLELEDWRIPEECDFHSLYEARNDDDIGDQINKKLRKIETANSDKFEGIFSNVNFNSDENLGETRDRNSRLRKLLEGFNRLPDFGKDEISDDIIGNSYIYLIERFASDAGKKAGEFYTPHKISELVARLAAPVAGDKICDPACGSGSLLLEAARVLYKQFGTKNYRLAGMEINNNTWAMARMNFLLSALPNTNDARLEKCNALTDPQLKDGDDLLKFEVIVANPPFSLKNWGAGQVEDDRYGRFHRGVPSDGRGDWAFLSHMIAAATPQKGRVAVIVPHGVLFRGASEGRIRRSVIEDNLLDTVVGLPSNLFQSTGIPVTILVFDKSRQPGGVNADRKDVLFIDASRDFDAGKNQNSIADEHIGKILETRKKRKSVPGYAYLASPKDIEVNDYNLNIPRYVDTYKEDEVQDPHKLQLEIEELETQLTTVRAEMKEHLVELEKQNSAKK